MRFPRRAEVPDIEEAEEAAADDQGDRKTEAEGDDRGLGATAPESVAEEQPRMALVVMISDTDIMIHGKVITSIEAILKADSDAASRLKTALQTELGKSRQQDKSGNPVRHEATIMGDRDIPYKILKQVMASCTEAGFARISLAVLQKPLQES